MKQNVTSFDVFDTLIARNVINPTDIFDIIEHNFPYPNFKKYRILAEQKSGLTLDSIYKEFKNITNDSETNIDILKEYEIQTEINNSFLIKSNVNLVNDGDILISDMYLNSLQILRILNSLGFNKNVKIFSSSIGMSKHKGTLYNYLLNMYNITLHIGDNEYSDYFMAKKYNIPCQITNLHKFNNTELFFINKQKYRKFGFLLRMFRLQNPYNENSKNFLLYNDQSNINIPLLVMLSFHLKQMLINENRSTILFYTRDSCLLQIVFQTLFPDISSKTFHSSRVMNYSNNEEYDKYILDTYNDSNCIIFDGHGTFNSGRKLYMRLFNSLPRIHIFSLGDINTLIFKNLSYNIKSGTLMFERYNVDTIGRLIDLKDGNFIREEVKGYSLNNAEIYKYTIHSFCTFLQSQNICDLNIFNTMSPQLIINYNNKIYNVSKSNIIDDANIFFDSSIVGNIDNDKNINQKNINQKNINQKNINQKNINQKNINQKTINQKTINQKNINQKTIYIKKLKMKFY